MTLDTFMYKTRLTLCIEYGPFLFLFVVKDAKGDPVPNATLDWWQADSDGGYYFRSWTLRGKVTTDAHGRAEVLSVNPGEYGIPFMGKRSGHVHLNVSGTAGKHRFMTTQVYVCEGNKSERVHTDMCVFFIANGMLRLTRSAGRTSCGHRALTTWRPAGPCPRPMAASDSETSLSFPRRTWRRRSASIGGTRS